MGREADSERTPRCGASHCLTRRQTAPISLQLRGKTPLFPSELPFSPRCSVGRTLPHPLHVEIALFARKSRVWSTLRRSKHGNRTRAVRFARIGGRSRAEHREIGGIDAPHALGKPLRVEKVAAGYIPGRGPLPGRSGSRGARRGARIAARGTHAARLGSTVRVARLRFCRGGWQGTPVGVPFEASRVAIPPRM